MNPASSRWTTNQLIFYDLPLIYIYSTYKKPRNQMQLTIDLRYMAQITHPYKAGKRQDSCLVITSSSRLRKRLTARKCLRLPQCRTPDHIIGDVHTPSMSLTSLVLPLATTVGSTAEIPLITRKAPETRLPNALPGMGSGTK